jgi:hypothetical protein
VVRERQIREHRNYEIAESCTKEKQKVWGRLEEGGLRGGGGWRVLAIGKIMGGPPQQLQYFFNTEIRYS